MVKKLTLLLCLVLLSFAGCNLSEDDSDSLSAPDMGSPSDLSAFTGSVPSEDKALALFLAAYTAMNGAMSDLPDVSHVISPSILSSKMLQPKGQDGEEWNDEVIHIGGGTITLNGTENSTWTDFPPTFDPNKEYTFTDKENINMTVDIENVTVPEFGTPTYTLNGKYVEKLNMSTTIKATTDSMGNPISESIKMSLSISEQMGIAMSVSSSTGFGGKFIVSFPFEYSITDTAVTSPDDIPQDLLEELANTTVTLNVYDNNNALKYSIECHLEELLNME
ncbi:MAG TPA: hypothetical protein PLG79_09950 [Spirochaetales bacterium]|nr:hypothetical protein [Spirochaetales bacterium]HOV39034.1 hypothetical protein [Spirochaetales bacterium]